jgi:GH25 family lysozyme M1 (1,4-beta-N-acetylmuramidase)
MVTRLKVHGADLSHHNRTPDFEKAKAAGLEWCIHKAVEGSTVNDATYAERRKLARDAGLLWGSYGFGRPDADGKDAKLEAMHHFKVAKPRAGDIRPALDFEVKFGNSAEWCRTWQKEMARLLKTRGLVSKRALHYGPDDFTKDYPAVRWVPRYNMNNTPPIVPWDIFQFSNGKLGVPNSFPGLGNVDLNFMRDGFTMKDLILRPVQVKVKVEPEYEELLAGHASLQYSDTERQKRHDATIIFRRASRKDLTWVTGTEAGEADTWSALTLAADNFGYKIHRHRSNWVAVDQNIIKPGTWETGEVFVMDNDRVAGPGHDSAFPWVRFQHINERIGQISVAGAHYPTKGRLPSDPNFWVNQEYAKALGAWAAEHGQGTALAFVGGDFNMPDIPDRPDIFFDQPLTTASAEVGKIFNTGHGPIDHISSYDNDARVEATDWRVYDDKKLSLYTDHYFCEADYDVRLLAA